MRKVFIFMCIVALLLGAAIRGCGQNVIGWSNRSLLYSDFILVDSIIDDVAAVSCTGLRLVGTNPVRCVAVFYKRKSYISQQVQDEDLEYILHHEKGHFDITEYFAENFNKIISRMKVVNQDKVLKLLHSFIAIKARMQDAYDNETECSRDHIEQNLWDNRIASMLSDVRNK